MAKLSQGDAAPDFEATSDTGSTVRLSEFRGKKNVVLYFYPEDDTPGCTTEAQQFRDDFEEIKYLATEILGVSTDSVASHQAFKAKHELPFMLLADPEGKICRQYGALGLLGGKEAKRITYLIDRDGKIAKFWPVVNPSRHTREVILALRELTKGRAD